MEIVRFIFISCLIFGFVFFVILLCGMFACLAWPCFKDTIIDWKQYRLKDRIITIQEYNKLMDSLQEVKDSMQVLGDTLRAKGLLDSCEAIACSQSELD